MKQIKGLLFTIITSISLIFISKIFIIVNLFLIPYLLNRFYSSCFKCPVCGNLQSDSVVLNVYENSIMTHGRITKSGKIDKRYNNRFASNSTIEHGIICNKCNNAYKTIRKH